MTKICSKCDKEKSLSLFYKRAKSPDGYSVWCKECFKNYDRERYSAGDKSRKSRNKSNARQRNQIYVWKYQLQHPCVDCGETDILVLDFDHLPEYKKVIEVSVLVTDGASLKRIFAEIAKCEVVCSNCHRRRTFKRSGNLKEMLGRFGFFDNLKNMELLV